MNLGFTNETGGNIGEAFRFVFEKLYSEKTGLIYDFLASDAPDGATFNLPSPEMIEKQVPNPCGWMTGMEDSAINNGVMIEALLLYVKKTGNESVLPLLHGLIKGYILLGTVSESEGFLARSVSPVDGKSHYNNSSRDQYTHWVYTAVLYLRSGYATEDEKAAITRVLVSFARKAEREIRGENYEFLREDGKIGIVCKMWGKIDPHEYLRLPMIYLAAYNVSKDEHWKDKYLEYREEAFARSEDIYKEGVMDKFIYAYALLQMQLSLRLICDLESDGEYKTRAAALMDFVAGYSEKYSSPGVGEADAPQADVYNDWRALKADFLGFINGYAYFLPQPSADDSRELNMRNAAESVIIRCLAADNAVRPREKEKFDYVVSKTDFKKATSYWPVLFCNAWAQML